MQINSPVHVHGPQPINPQHNVQRSRPTENANATSQADQLDLSEAAQALSNISDIPEIRSDRIEAIRTQIAEGVYDSPDKLDTAIDRILDEMA